MKIYRCKTLDESLDDWETCFVAVMENMDEQKSYYDSRDHSKALETLLRNSGYDYYNCWYGKDIDFRFPYEMDEYPYADKIAKNIEQIGCDSYYKDFEYVPPAQYNEETRVVEVGKNYQVYAPFKRRLLDEVEVTEVVGSCFYCYSTMFDYDTAYDLSDGIVVEQIDSEE